MITTEQIYQAAKGPAASQDTDLPRALIEISDKCAKMAGEKTAQWVAKRLFGDERFQHIALFADGDLAVQFCLECVAAAPTCTCGTAQPDDPTPCPSCEGPCDSFCERDWTLGELSCERHGRTRREWEAIPRVLRTTEDDDAAFGLARVGGVTYRLDYCEGSATDYLVYNGERHPHEGPPFAWFVTEYADEYGEVTAMPHVAKTLFDALGEANEAQDEARRAERRAGWSF